MSQGQRTMLAGLVVGAAAAALAVASCGRGGIEAPAGAGVGAAAGPEVAAVAAPVAQDATWPAHWGPPPSPPGWDKHLEPRTDAWKKHPQVLRFNNGTEIETLDPAIMTGVPEHRIVMAVYEGLTMYDPESSQPRPGVAESWVISDAGRTYTFRLRADAKWSNGDPVKAEDFRYAWWRVLAPQPPSQYSYMLHDILNAKAFDEGRIADRELPLHADPECTKPSGSALLPGDVCEVQKTHPEALPEKPTDEETARVALRVKCGEKTGWVKKQALRGDWKLDGPAYAKVGIEVRDAHTLVVRLSDPKSFFLEILAHETLMPVHRATLEKHGKDAFRVGNLVGNGCHVLKSWVPRVSMVLEKSPTYWGRDRVELQTIIANPNDSMDSAYNMYRNDELDWMLDIPAEKIDEVKLHPDYYVAPLLSTYFYRINCTDRPHPTDPKRKHPLCDPRVRMALNLAIDKKTICEKVTKAGQIPAQGFVPPGTAPWYPTFQGLPYDREKARALLAEAGYADPKSFPPFEILYNTHEGHKKAAEAIAGMWRDNLGVKVGLANTEWKVYLETVDRLGYDVARAGWVGDYLDPMNFMDMWVTKGGNNSTGWSNAEYDTLIEQAREEGDPAKRRAIFQRCETIAFMHEFPIIPIYYYVNKGLKKPKVQGVHLNIKDLHAWQYIWIEPEE